MPATAEQVFAVVHDIGLRLEWDPMLAESRFTRGSLAAAEGATFLCRAKWWHGGIGIEARYRVFEPGVAAEIEMINEPPFFAQFEASIRHAAAPEGSILFYQSCFTTRPRWIGGFALAVLRWETVRRLRSLAQYVGRERVDSRS